MYWVPLSWFVNSTLSCPTPFSFVYCYVITSEDAGYDWVEGDVTECIVYMFRAMTHNLFFPVLFLFDWVGGLLAQLSKVLKVVCWAGSVPFPPVSLQRQVVCLLLWPVFMCFHHRGEPTLFPGWYTNKSYVIATSDLWLFIHASNLLPSTPHPTPLHRDN